MKKSYFIGGGVLAGALLLALLINFYPGSGERFVSNDIDLDWDKEITRLDNNAFGLFVGTEGGRQMDGMAIDMAESALSSISAPTSAPAGMGGGGVSSESAKMIASMPNPNIIKYNYIYTGEAFEIPGEGDVYKKINQEGAGKKLAQKLSGDLGLLDLSKFTNTSVSNFSISEDREFGYSVYFNLIDNNVSINSNWQRWPHPEQDCRDEACFTMNRTKIDDVPEDSDLIKIANAAISEYGIDMTDYGEPRVYDSWRRSYDMAEDKTTAYVPESFSVLYPFKIDGKEVHEDYGNGIGITVNVNIRYKKMSGIQGIRLNDYQASRYKLETDSGRLLKLAEQGGLYGAYVPSEPTKEVDIELGTPEIGLIMNWKQNEKTGSGEEYYVPALIFPIIGESEETYFSRKSISIPLLKDLLDEAETRNNQPGIIEPMPLMRSSVETPGSEPMDTSVESPEAMMIEEGMMR